MIGIEKKSNRVWVVKMNEALFSVVMVMHEYLVTYAKHQA